MRAAKGVFFFALVLISCNGPSRYEPVPEGFGELTCVPAADLVGMTCTDVCMVYGAQCEPSCLGQDAAAMYFAKDDECLDANANQLNDNPVHTCDEPIEVDPDLPYAGCCC
jgi:hypothetical protein